jgi:hypothetical protein
MKKILLSIAAILAVMLILPLCVELFETPAGKQGWYFTMFLAINPVFSGVMGLFAGSDVKRLWWVPLATVLCFPLGFWLSISEIETDIFAYCPIYLGIALVATLISHLVAERGQKSK